MAEDDDSSGWQLTESDPGVFTYVEHHQYCVHHETLISPRHRASINDDSELFQLLGTSLVMDEVYSLEPSALHEQTQTSPVHALIFLFKWLADLEKDDEESGSINGTRGPRTGGVYDEEFSGFFAKQVSRSTI